MRSLTLIAGALVFGLAAPALAQTPPPVPVAAPAQAASPDGADVLTWEELPEVVRLRAERLIGRTPGQAVLHVDDAFTPDGEAHAVDHGAVLLLQHVRPAGVARITQSVRNANKYGPVGAVMWPAVGPEGDYWCWRRSAPDAARPTGNIYCYLDKNGDGQSEKLMEDDLWPYRLPGSRFQFTDLGHDEGVEEPARFAVEPGALGENPEVVAVRYIGVARGRVDEAGRFGPGRLDFELLTGPDAAHLDQVRVLSVVVDREGRGGFTALNGIRFEVDGVTADGMATVRMISGLPTGRALLSPPMTREDVLEMAAEFLNPDGSPKRPPETAPPSEGPPPPPAPPAPGT